MRLRRRQADGLAHCGNCPFYFAFESPRIQVVDDGKLRVAYPRVDQLPVECNCLFDCFVARLVVCTGVELSCTVRCSNHVNDGLVASVTQLNRAPMGLVEECLPYLSRRVCMAVHDTTIAEDDRRLLRLERRLQKDILEAHLRLHDLDLEANLIHKRHLVRLDKAASFHHQCGGFGNKEHLEALQGQVLRNSGQSRSLACTRTSSQTDTIDWVLGRRYHLWMVQMHIMHPCGRSGVHGGRAPDIGLQILSAHLSVVGSNGPRVLVVGLGRLTCFLGLLSLLLEQNLLSLDLLDLLDNLFVALAQLLPLLVRSDHLLKLLELGLLRLLHLAHHLQQADENQQEN